MKKIAIKVEYLDKTYQSDFVKYTQQTENNLKENIIKLTKGKGILDIRKEGNTIYIPPYVLCRSIITLIYSH